MRMLGRHASVVDDGDVCVTGVELAEDDGADSDEAPEVMITSD